MNIVITGGAGFLGQRLARSLLRDGLHGASIDHLVLVDRIAGLDFGDERVTLAVGDIADPDFVSATITPDIDIVFHLAAVVSGEAEADFDLGMRVNIDASRFVLDTCRNNGNRPRVVFTSSVAVFGPAEQCSRIDDKTSVDPRSSYGMEKAVAELLLKDFSRRGFVDGVVLRLPTISVRPGKPNRAASSFASGIIREPLAGVPADLPVPVGTILWLLSPRCAVQAMIAAATLKTDGLGTGRVINLPGVSVSVDEMLNVLAAEGGSAARELVRIAPDKAIESIVASWPDRWDDSRARSLGFCGDADFTAIVRAYMEDDVPASPVPLR